MAPDVSRFPQGVWVSVANLTAARPVGTIVLNELDSELYLSTNATVAAYTQLTGGGGGGGAQQLLEQYFVDGEQTTDAAVRRYATLAEAFVAAAAASAVTVEFILAGGTYAWGLAEALPICPQVILTGRAPDITVVTVASGASISLDETNILFRDMTFSALTLGVTFVAETSSETCSFANASLSGAITTTNYFSLYLEDCTAYARFVGLGRIGITATRSVFAYSSITDVEPMFTGAVGDDFDLSVDTCSLSCISIETTTIFNLLTTANIVNTSIYMQTSDTETLSLFTTGESTAITLQDVRFSFPPADTAIYDFVNPAVYEVRGAMLYIDVARVTDPPTGAWISDAGHVVVV